MKDLEQLRFSVQQMFRELIAEVRGLGPQSFAKSITANYTIERLDNNILADATAAAITVTLPTAAEAVERRYTIKRVSSGSNLVTVATPDAATIDGQAFINILDPFGDIIVITDGVNWFIV